MTSSLVPGIGDLESVEEELWSPLITCGGDHLIWAAWPPPPLLLFLLILFFFFLTSKWIFLFNSSFGFCHCIGSLLGVCAKWLQSRPALCDPTDSPPGSSVHGILQARTLECVALLFSRGSSGLRGRTCVSYVSCTDRWVLYH